MADLSEQYGKALELLAADPAFAELLHSGAPLLLWDESGTRLLWSSAAAWQLSRCLTLDDEGHVDPALPVAQHLRTLAGGAAPRIGVRMERLRFSPNRLVPGVTSACRVLELPSGTVLATALVGPLPELPTRPRGPSRLPEMAAEPAKSASSDPEPAGVQTPLDLVRTRSNARAERMKQDAVQLPEPLETPLEDPVIQRLRDLGRLRFVWQADAEGRFTAVSETLADVVGRAKANVLGKRWDEIAGNLVVDESGAVADHFARRETWSAQTVLWRVENSHKAVAVDIAGMPILGPNRELMGFRGFGVCRTDVVSDSAPDGEGAAAGPSLPDAEQGAASVEASGSNGDDARTADLVAREPDSGSERNDAPEASIPSASEPYASLDIASSPGADASRPEVVQSGEPLEREEDTAAGDLQPETELGDTFGSPAESLEADAPLPSNADAAPTSSLELEADALHAETNPESSISTSKSPAPPEDVAREAAADLGDTATTESPEPAEGVDSETTTFAAAPSDSRAGQPIAHRDHSAADRDSPVDDDPQQEQQLQPATFVAAVADSNVEPGPLPDLPQQASVPHAHPAFAGPEQALAEQNEFASEPEQGEAEVESSPGGADELSLAEPGITPTEHSTAGLPAVGSDRPESEIEPPAQIQADPARALAAPGAADPQEDQPLAAPASDRPSEGDAHALGRRLAGAFGALKGAVGAQLGTPRPVPLRSDDVADTELPQTTPPLEQARPIGGASAKREPPRLSLAERSAFREIARALGARFEDDTPTGDPPVRSGTIVPLTMPRDGQVANLLDRLPLGLLIHRGDQVLVANRHLLELTGYDSAGALGEGGLQRLFPNRETGALPPGQEPLPLSLTGRGGESIPVEARLSTLPWDGEAASLMVVRRLPDAVAGSQSRTLERDIGIRDARLRELSSILDTATDGVIVIDDAGRILSLNRSAEALFGYDQKDVAGDLITSLLAPESRLVAADYLQGLRNGGFASLFNDGREILGKVRQGGLIPLFMTLGLVSEAPERKYCAVLRDITAFKKTETELTAAKQAAERTSAQKSDFLAKISHEVRTPLNAIIGFAEVMLEERFGPIGNERYKDYLKDIHTSGRHVISLVNDLLDLAKIESGRMELSFTGVSLNDVVTGCVGIMQAEAVRARIVMRTSFGQKLPAVVADERSVRQIVLNVLSNAIKFTDPGGQVIVSTALTDRGELAFRVRDTGVGMSKEELQAALEPFRQVATSRRASGTGLGLPLTKALVEANRGTLHITTAPQEGTLVEVVFPATRVLTE